MKKWKQVKIALKNSHNWKQYQQIFAHRQLHLLTTKIVLIFNPEIDLTTLVNLELKMMSANKKEGANMFVSVYETFNHLTNIFAKWNELAKFIFYINQTATYYYDQRHKNANVYNGNKVTMNQNKRHHYITWMASLDFNQTQTNQQLRSILKLVN